MNWPCHRQAHCPAWFPCLVAILLLVGSPVWLPAANPQVADALTLQPVQPGIQFDQLTAAEQAGASLTPKQVPAGIGWFLRSAEGQLLRRFVDTNQDKTVDLWCYYKDGIEVYRDIDSDFDGLADQYRWLGTSGTRWGVDRNGDQRIDHWKVISAAEVSRELIAALRSRDAGRFAALLVSDVDLQEVGVQDELALRIKRLTSEARAGFASLAERQTVVTRDSRWEYFGAGAPGLLPAGTSGIDKDLVVVENAAAVIETKGQHQQILLGSLMQVGRCWKLIDMPRYLGDPDLATQGGFFFQSDVAAVGGTASVDPMGLSEAEQKLMAQLEQVDRELAGSDSLNQKATLNKRRADLLQQLASIAKTAGQQSNWIRQMADIVSAAAQSGEYPGGVDRLQSLARQLQAKPGNPDVAYVTIRAMSASYGQSLQSPEADYEKIQSKWVEDLEAFIGRFPQSPDSSEAMLQLAISLEFQAESAKALHWYQQIESRFSQTPVAAKAKGAVRRLQAKGKSISLRGTTLEGRPVDLESLKGKHRAVVVHYWASWCGPCKEDMAKLKRLQIQLGGDLAILGVNLDSDPELARQEVVQLGATWPHLYEKGAMESRLANELGIITLPTMLLIDRNGIVVENGIHVSRLPAALDSLR